MRCKTVNPLAIILFISITSLTGCAQRERAGDITLASPSAAVVTQTQPRVLGVNNSQASDTSSAPVVVGSNLSTTFDGAVRTGDSANSNVSRAETSRADAVNSQISTQSNATSQTPLATTLPISPVGQASVAPLGSKEPTVPDNTSSSTAVNTSKIPARSTTIVRTAPDCDKADCPSIKVVRLNFAGRERFNAFLDQIMASMAEIETANHAPFRTMSEFASYFWKIAKPGYQVVLEATIKRGDEDLVVVQLDSYIFTGGAHGLSTTQYINWLPKTDKILSLEGMLLPGKMPAFEQVLKKQHAVWLTKNPQAIENPASYNKLWPFVPTDNAALLAEGLALTYDPYTIAPYSFGRPTLVIPYSELQGILQPQLLTMNEWQN